MVRGRKPERKDHERDLANARTYAEWMAAATELDRSEGKDDWRDDDRSPHYDFELLDNRLAELRTLRDRGNVQELVFWLQEGLHGNFANLSNPALYGYARSGTKKLIASYVFEVARVLNYLCETELQGITIDERFRFFKRTGKVFGRSALMLSGGGALGIFHLGVIKALWLAGLLPRVISGSSVGSIVAGVAGTHNDDELPSFFDPAHLNTAAWQSLGILEGLKKRALMSPQKLEACLDDNIGAMSFVEAFQHTGRIIDVTVSPVTEHQQPRLLNYLTAPNVLVTSAAEASCAVPGLFPPVALKAKSFTREIVPYLPTMRWQDGTLKSDLPMLRLSRLHNVNHYIVSQTNPYVLPFIRRRRAGKGFLPMARGLVTSSLAVNSKHLLDVTRAHLNNGGLARVLDEVYGIVDQRYRGDITIAPKIELAKIRRMFSELSRDQVAELILDGERATWPHIEQIRITTAISQTFDQCIQRLKISQNQHPAGPVMVSVPWERRARPRP
ncbi:MAG: DUF3336 domain-containing protein [Deltaproteobacteria bacterium]|nr:DUF3336 domain-containing protein [Deltaproteobacteria bacterium]